MYETSKCLKLRKERGDFRDFLHGNGIDIGAGPDPLKIETGNVRAWDVPDGDAQLMAGVPDNTFDFVYSSHCLEHMRDVAEALKNWTRITKPGGFVYTVVPDYLLYEKLTWPSRFNSDHKQSFSFLVPRVGVVRPNHYHVTQDLIPLMDSLGLQVVRWEVEDDGYNYNAGLFDQTMGNALAQLCIIAQKRA
jgi:SAM-dependent methyltransferase